MIRKTALIIGASSDIGIETAKKFAKNGYDLALTYNSNALDFEKIIGNNTNIKSFKLNLESNKEIEQFFVDLQKSYQSLDTMIICSGVAQKRKLIFDVSDEEMEKIFKVNTLAPIKCIKEYTKIIVNKYQSSIVLVGSFVEKTGCSCESVYAASKSALTGLCKSLSTELGNFGIRINVVSPGFIDTKMNNNLSTAEKEDISDMTPLSRLGKSEEVANAIFFLSCEEASFITGQTLFVDGGLILQ